ncbi:hypothetical protein BJY04DRAFT_224047 [Aspergillus karnatakaensis]|uniref:uncharacterized protein n=1 Tax=Aspergillus karnatakaensis TaxID=1810916 RepID=UPI003CCD3938
MVNISLFLLLHIVSSASAWTLTWKNSDGKSYVETGSASVGCRKIEHAKGQGFRWNPGSDERSIWFFENDKCTGYRAGYSPALVWNKDAASRDLNSFRVAFEDEEFSDEPETTKATTTTTKAPAPTTTKAPEPEPEPEPETTRTTSKETQRPPPAETTTTEKETERPDPQPTTTTSAKTTTAAPAETEVENKDNNNDDNESGSETGTEKEDPTSTSSKAYGTPVLDDPTPTLTAPTTETPTAESSNSDDSKNSDNADDADESSISVGAIAGGVVGGMLAIAAIGLLFFILARRKRAAATEHPSRDHVFKQYSHPGSQQMTAGAIPPTPMYRNNSDTGSRPATASATALSPSPMYGTVPYDPSHFDQGKAELDSAALLPQPPGYQQHQANELYGDEVTKHPYSLIDKHATPPVAMAELPGDGVMVEMRDRQRVNELDGGSGRIVKR